MIGLAKEVAALKEAARKRAAREGPAAQPTLPLGAAVRESLLETLIASGMAHVYEVLERGRVAACGPRHEHDAERRARRAGHTPGALVHGGRRVAVRRPRARTVGGREVELPSWRAWSDEDPPRERAIEQMVVCVSTRRYDRSREPVPDVVPRDAPARRCSPCPRREARRSYAPS
ncbi:MAG: hypothetical protein HY744_04150 [Deltaproteobacteria bacterium]|nr:hypothetical protein [Deltaproteobacteria bacterium]